ncbi:MAG: ornithine carbamoyltransferase [Planctomycetales bacterium]|nr:ornithine carbamoyltransferase [Planctomycetales bacterium]
MTAAFKGRHLLTLLDYSAEEIDALLDLSAKLKEDKKNGVPHRTLANKNIAILFEKPSTRTRCAFSVACADEGAQCVYLGKNDIHLGRDETVKDTARVLGRMFDGIAFRGFSHRTVEQLAEYAGVPVWNALTDAYHPTQALADFLTIREEKKQLKGIKLVYCGDGRNNVASSLMIASAKMGTNITVITHPSLYPSPAFLKRANACIGSRGGSITVTDDISAVRGADVIYNDVWASMGEESVIAERIRLLKPYQVNMALFQKASNPGLIYLHCLPCNHTHETQLGKEFPDICETSDEAFESGFSRVFDQAENRLHTIRAVMVATLGK